MKDLSSRWALAILLAPVLLILGLAFLGETDQASAKAPPPGNAVLAVAFVSSFANSSSVTSFQRVTLNVISVRLNPSTNPNVSVFDAQWVTIPVPAGVGRSFGVAQVSTGNNFGGNLSNSNTSVAIGEGRSEIQIDLSAIQNIAEIFNAQNIPAKTYHQVELVLDPQTPGNVVPLCPTLSGGEGCITYPAKFIQATPTPIAPPTIRTSATVDLSKSQHIVTPLVIQIDPGLGAPPTTFNQAVLITPTISVITNSTSVPPFTNPNLGSLQGTIMTNASSGFSGVRTESITAEIAGTSNIVETTLLPSSCKGKKTCEFIMYLPALDASVGGTNYDLVAAGKNTTYAVRSSVNVRSGLTTDIRSTPLTIVTKSTVSLTGKVVDFCTGVGVQAATLNLLVPDPLITPAPDCTVNPPTGCVVAASASTDEVGTFPLPGNGFNTAPFEVVPLPDTGKSYELVTTGAGFDRTAVKATTNSGRLKCTPTAKSGACNVAMNHGLLTGNVILGSGTGPLSVLVMAEDSGTNNIENLALVTIPFGSNTVPFTLNVPDNANVGVNGAVTQLDLFASAQDLFNGAPQKATGHSIAVVSAVAAPGPPVAGTPPTCSTVTAPDLGGITCVGHGSVSGTVTNPVGGDTVVLSKSGVQIESAPVIPPANPAAGNYALCAPADPLAYQLDHFRDGTSVANVPAVTLLSPVMVPTPTPSPGVTPTPCPGICELNPPNPNSGCLTCTGTTNVNF